MIAVAKSLGPKNASSLARYFPKIELLEPRLPPGDALRSTLMGASWIGLSISLGEPSLLGLENQDGEMGSASRRHDQPYNESVPAQELSLSIPSSFASPRFFSESQNDSPTTSPIGTEEGTAAAMLSTSNNTRESLLATDILLSSHSRSNPALSSFAPDHFLRSKDSFLSDAVPVQTSSAGLHPPTHDHFESTPLGPAGFQWDQKFEGPNWVLEDISFADPQNGFAAAELGKVLRTQDGGKTWDTVLNLGFPYYWYGVHALDAQRVVISGFNNSTGDGILRWTDDAGATWSKDLTLTGNPNFNRWLDKIAFVDDSNGIAMASWSGGNHATATGGQTASDWSFVQSDPSQSWFQGNFTFWPDGNVWVSGINFCHSPDYGQNWDCRHSIDPIFDGGGVSFPDADHGWVGGGSISPEVRGWVHRTVDGGQTWSERILDAPFPIRSVLFLNENIGFAVGGNVYSGVGGIYSTMDGGQSWNLDLDTGAEMKSIKAIRSSKNTVDVWTAGFGQGFAGEIFKTQVVLP
jgi:photosystem II stability/assembly factor-like uncharacterized protein